MVFDIKGLSHYEVKPRGSTINAKFYVGVLKRLKLRVHRNQPDIANNGKLYRDHTLAYIAFLVTRFPVDLKTSIVAQSTYSTIVLPDFFLFPHLKIPIKEHCFGTVDKIKKDCTTKALKDVLEDV